MTTCTCHDKKEWMRWHVTQSALLDERCMKLLEKVYNSGPSSIKSCTSRGPGGIRTSKGVIEHISPRSFYPQVCRRLNQHTYEDHRASSGLFSVNTSNSGACSRSENIKPGYRKRTINGVHVGYQPYKSMKRAVHPAGWNPDTTLPGGCRFLRCKLYRLRKFSKEL